MHIQNHAPVDRAGMHAREHVVDVLKPLGGDSGTHLSRPSDEWIKIKNFLNDALEFLSEPDRTVTHALKGDPVYNPDARNADWLRIDAANRAVLWLVAACTVGPNFVVSGGSGHDDPP
jgi:hypothetical protein